MRAWIAYITLAIVWGSTYFSIAIGLESFTPAGLVAIRYLAAGALALLLARVKGEPLPDRSELPHVAATGILMLALANGLVSWGQKFVDSGTTAILCSTSPIAFALLGRERLSRRSTLGLALGLGGVIVLAQPGAKAFDPRGVGAILVAVLLWAMGTLYTRRAITRGGLLAQVGIQMLAGGAVAALVAEASGGFTRGPLGWGPILALGYLALFGSLAGFSAYAYLTRVWPPTRMSTYVYLNPLVALVLGIWFRNEPFRGRLVLGMGIILAGVACLQVSRTRPISDEPLKASKQS